MEWLFFNLYDGDFVTWTHLSYQPRIHKDPAMQAFRYIIVVSFEQVEENNSS